jgi:hypothetical protein
VSAGEITMLDLFGFEIERARRYERAFTMLHVSRAQARNGSDHLDDIATELYGVLRQGDLLWVDDSGLLLLLPETGPDGADLFVQRVTAAVPALQRPGVVRRATFPHDGVTRGALFAILGCKSVGLPDPHDLPKLGVRGPRLMSSAQ